jgi:hypothetical protein
MLKTHRTNGTFGYARHLSRPFAKPKEPFFCQRTDRQDDNFSNTFYLEKLYNQNIKAILAA